MRQWIKNWFKHDAVPRHLRSGVWGEKQAARFLKKRKYSVVGRRIRVGRHDEIDLIAKHNGALVFVEVKTRRSEKFGRPFSAVNKEKRKRISRAAVGYLKREQLQPDFIRFDVIEIIGEPGGKAPEIRHIENAFQLDPYYRLWW